MDIITFLPQEPLTSSTAKTKKPGLAPSGLLIYNPDHAAAFTSRSKCPKEVIALRV